MYNNGFGGGFGGGLMALVTYGAPDTHLIGAPVVTYFRVKHTKHTNFGTEMDMAYPKGKTSLQTINKKNSQSNRYGGR